MAKATCATPPCSSKAGIPARIGSGRWCAACFDWWRNHDEDPANRPKFRQYPSACIVVEHGKQCRRPVVIKSRGWCEGHRYIAGTHGGDPTARVRSPRGSVPPFAYRAAHATTDACIIQPRWDGKRAWINHRGEKTPTARVVWTLAHGDPGELHVLHTCNGGSGENGCINIRHLYLGTDQDNANDRVKAGRSKRAGVKPR